jgi:hypothetical protein
VKKNDALARGRGRVWLNPPYKQPDITWGFPPAAQSASRAVGSGSLTPTVNEPRPLKARRSSTLGTMPAGFARYSLPMQTAPHVPRAEDLAVVIAQIPRIATAVLGKDPEPAMELSTGHITA